VYYGGPGFTFVFICFCYFHPSLHKLGASDRCLFIDIVAHGFVPPDTTYIKPASFYCKNSVLSCSQNFSTSNILPSMRDEIHDHTCLLHDIVPAVLYAAYFGQVGLHSVFFGSILRYILLCHIHLRQFFQSLLVNQICNVCTVMNVAYIFDK
jgi:hypothetical protein